MIREVKTNPYKVLKTFITENKNYIGLKSNKIKEIKVTELSIADRYSTGTQVAKKKLIDSFIKVNLVSKEQKKSKTKEETPIEEKKEESKKTISLKEIDDRLMTIDDFLK